MASPLWYFVLDRLNNQYSEQVGAPVSMMPTSSGFIFPVQGGKFSRGWGAARSGGRKHQGVDIFAPQGTPILAPSDGTVQNTSGDKSGLAVRFFDSAGNKYFMGHLSGYGDGGRAHKYQVKAGQVIGYVGNTGNARGTSPHVHFQYHPGGARAVDPYDLLTSWQKGTNYTNVDYRKEYGPASLGVPYASQIIQASQKHGIPVQLLSGLLYAESNFNPRAKSHAGAVGIAQFMPGTWKGLPPEYSKGSPLDPNVAIDAAGYYLKQQYNTFNDWGLALAAYNAGPGNVRKYKGIPPFKETQNYVKKVRGYKLPQGSGYQDEMSRQGVTSVPDRERQYLRSVARAGIARENFLDTRRQQRLERELSQQEQLLRYQKEMERTRQREQRLQGGVVIGT